MRAALTLLILGFALASCGSGAPSQEVRDREIARSDTLPVMGQERRLAVIAQGSFDGTGLAAEQRFDSLLEPALRARGINAIIVLLPPGKPLPVPKPELILADSRIPGAGDTAGVPVLRLDSAGALAGKPDLVQADGQHPNALGVETLVAAAGRQVAAELSVQTVSEK